jgi:hypothetical protein
MTQKAPNNTKTPEFTDIGDGFLPHLFQIRVKLSPTLTLMVCLSPTLTEYGFQGKILYKFARKVHATAGTGLA